MTLRFNVACPNHKTRQRAIIHGRIASAIIGGGGGDVYSYIRVNSAILIPFKINFKTTDFI